MRLSIQITMVSVSLALAGTAFAQTEPGSKADRRQHYEQLSNVKAMPMARPGNPVLTPAADAKSRQVVARIVSVDDGGVLVAVGISQSDLEQLSRVMRVVNREGDIRTNTIYNNELYVRYPLAAGAPSALKLESRIGHTVKLEVQVSQTNQNVVVFWRD